MRKWCGCVGSVGATCMGPRISGALAGGGVRLSRWSWGGEYVVSTESSSPLGRGEGGIDVFFASATPWLSGWCRSECVGVDREGKTAKKVVSTNPVMVFRV